MPFRTKNADRRIVILLAEDDPGDQELTRRALTQESFHVDLRIVEDGEEALDYLLRRGAFADPQKSPRPDLMLLDLNMPRVNGREVLREMKKHEYIARVPVIVLTTSEQEADILRSYDLGCSSYIQKPVDIDQFTLAVQQLGTYWFRVVTLPSCVGSI